jgi:glycogen operon protein
MLTMGDEVRRTQRGNNNAYSQDNEISWFDWTLVDRHADLHRFVKALIAFRMGRDVAIGGMRHTLNEMLALEPFEWHGVELNQPDWSDGSHSLAFCFTSLSERFRLHGMLNAYWEPLGFQLPPSLSGESGSWRRWIDTSLPSPNDITDWDHAPAITGTSYLVQARSTVLLVMPLGSSVSRGVSRGQTP